MKNKICIAIAILSILISCFWVSVGCSPLPGYITIDSRSALMQPTFYVSDDPYFQKRLRIGSIKVEKQLRSSEEKKQEELETPLNDDHTFTSIRAYRLWWEWERQGNNYETVWELELEYTDNFLIGVLKWLFTPIVSSLTYGEVPWGYQEKVKALPLEPEELYIVSMDVVYAVRNTAPLRFIIRLNDTGVPDRIEYLWIEYLWWNGIFERTRSYLKLY